ncbi:MAG: sortase [Bacilli bacterium]|nr:sortase [Bacilli bacterium]
MLNLKNKISAFDHRQITIIGVLCAVIGIILLTYNYIDTKISNVYETMNLSLLKTEQPQISNEPTTEKESDSPNESEETHVVENAPTVEQQAVNDQQSKSYYIGTLEIPRLSFQRGFVSKGHTLNNVNKNIAVMSASDYPDKANGNFIVAGHSGNSSVAFFKDLWQLEKNDIAVVTYKEKKYTYQITNIYLQPKVGTVAIYRNKNKQTLTLITCTKDDSQHQTIYIAELIKEQNL